MRDLEAVLSHLLIAAVIAAVVGGLAWALADTAVYGLGAAVLVLLVGLVTAPPPRRHRGHAPPR